MDFAAWIRAGAGRLTELLFAPSSREMLHVQIAWGALSLWFVIALICGISLWSGRKKQLDLEENSRFYLLMLIPFTAGNLLSLLMLTQVDGNYFELLYVLWGIWGFALLDQVKPGIFKRTAAFLAVVVVCYGGLITGLTNWSESGYQGLFPAKLIHRGYYDHELACCVQTYEDVTGTQGNVMLVKTMDNFVQFLDYAKTNYIYIEAGYIGEGERADTLTCDLVEYGILTPICYENGSVLARVDVHGEKTEESEKRLEEFKQNRRLRES